MVDITDTKHVNVTVNSEPIERVVGTNRTLVEWLRDELNLTGTTEGCGVGACGCCTVLVDGEPVNSCLELAVNMDGRTVTTIEGLRTDDGIGPVQEAFLSQEGFQCGYCTPGMIMMAKRLLEEHPNPDKDIIEEFMSENLCRCTGYTSIRNAINDAAERTATD